MFKFLSFFSLSLFIFYSASADESLGNSRYELNSVSFANVENSDAQEKALKQLKSYVEKWDKEKALDWALNIKNRNVKDLAIRDVTRLWAERDPENTVKWALNFKTESLYSKDLLLAAAAKGWAATDPAAALKLTEKISNDNKSFTVPNIVLKAASTNLKETVKWVRTIEDDIYLKDNCFVAISKVQLDKDLDNALAFAKEIVDLRKKFEALRKVINKIAQTDPQKAVSAAESEKDKKNKSLLLMDITEIWVKTDIKAAEIVADKIPDPVLKAYGLIHIAREISNDNPDKGLKYTEKINIVYLKNRARYSIISDISVKNAEKAAQYVFKITDDKLLRSALSLSASQWLKQDEAKALEWIGSLPQKYKDFVLTKLTKVQRESMEERY